MISHCCCRCIVVMTICFRFLWETGLTEKGSFPSFFFIRWEKIPYRCRRQVRDDDVDAFIACNNMKTTTINKTVKKSFLFSFWFFSFQFQSMMSPRQSGVTRFSRISARTHHWEKERNNMAELVYTKRMVRREKEREKRRSRGALQLVESYRPATHSLLPFLSFSCVCVWCGPNSQLKYSTRN